MSLTSVQAIPTSEDQGKRKTRAERYIHKLLSDYKVIYDYRSYGFYIQPDGRKPRIPLMVDNLIARLYVDSDRFGGLGRDKIQAVLTCIMNDAEIANLEDLRARIRGMEARAAGDKGQTLKTWVEAVCSDGHELAYEIMYHWVWTVKRKIFMLPVSTPICPILRGLTQGGKTTATRLLSSPLKEYTRVADLKQVADDREWRTLLGRFYVVILDEMAKATKANVESLKAVISAETLDPRILGLNMHSHITMKSCFIGSSNKPLNQIITDTTSAARYWEIHCKDRLDWDMLNNMDYALIWGTAPHDTPSRIDSEANLRNTIQKIQHDELRYKDPVEIWIEDLGIMPRGDLIDSKGAELNPHEWNIRFIPTKRLYEHYKTFCTTFTYQALNVTTFGSVLRSLGFESQRRRWGKHNRQERGFGIFINKSIYDEHFLSMKD